MEGDKDDNDQSDDIKSNEGHSDKKLPILYHLTDISSSSTRRLDETESKAGTIKSNSLK